MGIAPPFFAANWSRLGGVVESRIALMTRSQLLWSALGVAAIGSVATLLYMVFLFAPIEARMGIVQKIFYIHVPSAYGMYIGFLVCGVSSGIFLVNRSERADAWAVTGAEVGMMFATVVLLTGPIWARKAWGIWWPAQDPRLMSTLLAAMVFAAYLALRSFGAGGGVERRFAAGIGVVGILDLPIIHYATRRWGGQHPTVITSKGGGLHPDMATTLGVGFFAFTLLALWLLWTRFRLERSRQQSAQLALEAAQLGIMGGSEDDY